MSSKIILLLFVFVSFLVKSASSQFTPEWVASSQAPHNSQILSSYSLTYGGLAVFPTGGVVLSGGYQNLNAVNQQLTITNGTTSVYLPTTNASHSALNGFMVLFDGINGNPIGRSVVSSFGSGNPNVLVDSVTADNSGNIIYVVKYYEGTITQESFYSETSLGVDTLLVKFLPDGTLAWNNVVAQTINSGSDVYTNQDFYVTVDQNNNIYVLGLFNGVYDFDPTSNQDVRSFWGNYSTPYLSKFDANGNRLWTKTDFFAPIGISPISWINRQKIIEDNSGQLIVGFDYHVNLPPYGGYSNGYNIVTLNPVSGMVISTENVYAYWVNLNDIAADSTGNYLAITSLNSIGHIIKRSTSGLTLWDQTLPFENPRAISFNSCGEVVVSGNDNLENYSLAKLNKINGAITNIQNFAFPSNSWYFMHALRQFNPNSGKQIAAFEVDNPSPIQSSFYVVSLLDQTCP